MFSIGHIFLFIFKATLHFVKYSHPFVDLCVKLKTLCSLILMLHPCYCISEHSGRWWAHDKCTLLLLFYYKYLQISSDYDQKRFASCLYIKFYFTLYFFLPGGCGVGQTAGKQTRWRRPGATQKAVAAHWSVPSDSGFCVYSPPLGALGSPLPFVWSEENLSAYVIHCKINRDESEHSTEYGQFEGVHLQISWSAGLFRCYGFAGAFSFSVFCSPSSNKVMQFIYQLRNTAPQMVQKQFVVKNKQTNLFLGF